MRVSELANELGKTSKEVLDIIKQNHSSAALCTFTYLRTGKYGKKCC